MDRVRAPAGRAPAMEVPVHLVLSLVVIGAVVSAWAHVCVHLASLQARPGGRDERCCCCRRATARRPGSAR